MTKKEERAEKFYDAYLHLSNCRASRNLGDSFYVVGASLMHAADGLEELSEEDAKSGLSIHAEKLSYALKSVRIPDTTSENITKFMEQALKLWKRAAKEAGNETLMS